MKIYLAARYSRREELCEYREVLQMLGHEVTSRWLHGDHETDDQARFAQEDWDDIMDANVVISFTEEPRSTNGRGARHVEFGAALAVCKRCIVIGPRENVFHHLPEVEVYDTWADFIGLTN